MHIARTFGYNGIIIIVVACETGAAFPTPLLHRATRLLQKRVFLSGSLYEHFYTRLIFYGVAVILFYSCCHNMNFSNCS